MTVSLPQVRGWLERVRVDVEGGAMAQVDLDELFDPPPPRAVAAGLGCLEAMQDFARRLTVSPDALLVIPLPAADQLLLTYPSLGELVDGIWKYGPGLEVPALYLLPGATWRLFESGEEYRRAIDLPFRMAGIASYYRTWRTVADEARGWEYNRAIFIHTASQA